MDALLIGHFQEQALAESTAQELSRAGLSAEEMCLFYLNPHGHHHRHPLGGDEDESEGTHEASAGAVSGALKGGGAGALLGAAFMPVAGPVAPLVGAAIGASGGGVVGALNRMEHDAVDLEDPGPAPVGTPDPLHPHKSGYVLAVAVPTPEQRDKVLTILRARTADLEETRGTLLDGDWIDFDPLAPRQAVT